MKIVRPYDGREPFSFDKMDQLSLYDPQDEIPEGSIVLVTFTIGHYSWNPSDREKPSTSADVSKSPSKMAQFGYKKVASLNLQGIVVLHEATDEVGSNISSYGEIV